MKIRGIVLISIVCLFVTACGPADTAEEGRGKEFMADLGKDCPKCGKTKINLFGGEK